MTQGRQLRHPDVLCEMRGQITDGGSDIQQSLRVPCQPGAAAAHQAMMTGQRRPEKAAYNFPVPLSFLLRLFDHRADQAGQDRILLFGEQAVRRGKAFRRIGKAGQPSGIHIGQCQGKIGG